MLTCTSVGPARASHARRAGADKVPSGPIVDLIRLPGGDAAPVPGVAVTGYQLVVSAQAGRHGYVVVAAQPKSPRSRWSEAATARPSALCGGVDDQASSSTVMNSHHFRSDSLVERLV